MLSSEAGGDGEWTAASEGLASPRTPPPTSSSWPGLTLPGRLAVHSEGQETEQELGMLGGS